MERNVRHYDIRDSLQALQFVSILRRLASYGVKLHTELLKGRLAISDESSGPSFINGRKTSNGRKRRRKLRRKKQS
jgi:hypothetical protein